MQQTYATVADKCSGAFVMSYRLWATQIAAYRLYSAILLETTRSTQEGATLEGASRDNSEVPDVNSRHAHHRQRITAHSLKPRPRGA